MTTHYKLLGVKPNADTTVIKAAFRKALKEHHPDVNSGDAAAEQRSRKIIEAHNVLKNPKLRARYNHALQHGRTQQRRMLLIVVLVSAGIVTTGSLLFLHLVLAAKDAAPPGEMLVASEQAAHVTGAVEPAAPGEAAPEPENTRQQAPHEVAWQAIEKTGTMAELWVFAKTHPKTSEGALAEIRLCQLIDASDDRAALEALRVAAAGRVADRALRCLEKLTAQLPAITASLPQERHVGMRAAEPVAPPSEAPSPHADNASVRLAVLPPAHGASDANIAAAGNPLTGKAALEHLLATRPTDTGGFLMRASAWLARDDTTRAMADYDAAIRLDESSIPALHGRGLLWLRLGDVERALADLDHAIRLSFEDPIIYRDRGVIWLAKGRYDRAIADLDRAIKLAPDLPQAYFDRGMAYKSKGETDKAQANFDEAVRRDPALAPASRRAMSGGFDQTASESPPSSPR